MVVLTPQQNDALVELVNIAFERTAASLSELTGQRVQIGLPEVAVCPIEEVYDVLRKNIDGEVVPVHQVFAGSVAATRCCYWTSAGRCRSRRCSPKSSPPSPAGWTLQLRKCWSKSATSC